MSNTKETFYSSFKDFNFTVTAQVKISNYKVGFFAFTFHSGM